MNTVILSYSFSSSYLRVALAHGTKDSLDNERLAKMIALSEVVVRTDINVPKFIERVKNDTTFYKAFRNLHVLGFTSLNDIRIMDKKGKAESRYAKQDHAEPGQWLPDHGSSLSETTQGDFYNNDRSFNYYTAELYAGLFFTKGQFAEKIIL